MCVCVCVCVCACVYVCVVPIAGTQALARGRSAEPSFFNGGLARRSDITPPIREETRPPSATITALLPLEGNGNMK